MAMKAVKVTRKGQITLPADLRREFGIEEGDLIYVRKGDLGIEIVTPEDWVTKTAGMFRDYAGEEPLEWDRDDIWTEIARERFERTLDAASHTVAESPSEPYDHD